MTLAKTNKTCQEVARYCSYQERPEQEVRAKLRALGITQKAEEDQFIQVLKAEKFLDEERYIEAFIRGRVLGKHWGKRKLLVALNKKGLDPALIQKGLDAIEEADYLQGLREVADRKKQSLTGKDPKQHRQKLSNYLRQKGYEPALVEQTVQASIAEQPGWKNWGPSTANTVVQDIFNSKARKMIVRNRNAIIEQVAPCDLFYCVLG